MAGVLQHLRSSTLDKRPNPASMVDGQVAINYASGSPGMFFKDSNGDLVKVGPVHVGATAPNLSPASGGTAGNSKGEQWLDTSGGTYVFKIWDGAAWRSEAGEFVNAAGDTMTGSLTMGVSADIVFEGSVDDGFETTLTVANPTADRTITLPNVTGTVVTTGDSGTVTSTMIADGTIVNADVNASAAIAGTKISPDFGSQNVITTGTSTTASFIPTSSTAPTNGLYLPAANNVALSTDGQGRLFVDASGNVGVGAASSGNKLEVNGTAEALTLQGFDCAQGTNSLALRALGSGANNGFLQNNYTEISFSNRRTSDGSVGTVARIRSIAESDQTSSWPTSLGFYVRRFSSDFQSFRLESTGAAVFQGPSSEFARIDSSGRLLVGTATSYDSTSALQLKGASGSYVSQTYVVNNGSNLVAGNGLAYLIFRDALNSGQGAWIGAVADGTWVTSPASYPTRLVFSTTANGTGSPTPRMTIKSDGKVGIGTTEPTSRLTVYETSTAASAADLLYVGTAGGGGFNIECSNLSAANPDWAIRTFTGEAITFKQGTNERARIDSSGRLLVGTSNGDVTVAGNFGATTKQVLIQTSDIATFTGICTKSDGSGGIIALGKSRSGGSVSNNDKLGLLKFAGHDGVDYDTAAAQISAEVDGTPGANNMPGRLVFSTNPGSPASSPTERMKIKNTGSISCYQTGSDALVLRSSQAAGTTNKLITALHSGTGVDSGGTTSFIVYTNGDVVNTNNSYGQLTSDERFKQDIVDANSQWDDIKNIRITNYHWKSDPTGPMLLGPIAQELQAVSPGLVDKRIAVKEDEAASGGLVSEGDEVLGFKASILYMKAVKALQEAMERIETLEAKVAALESA